MMSANKEDFLKECPDPCYLPSPLPNNVSYLYLVDRVMLH